MNGCIVTINSGHDRFMGYAFSSSSKGIKFKTSNVPVFKSGKNLLIGLTGNESLINLLKVSPLIIGSEVSPQQAVTVIRENLRYEDAEILILTTNNFVYYYNKGTINIYGEYDEPYMAIGQGSEVALGAMYGMDSSRLTVREKMEISLQAVIKYYPEFGKNVGHFNI